MAYVPVSSDSSSQSPVLEPPGEADEESSRAEAIAQAKRTFDLVIRINMLGPFRCSSAIHAHLGLAPDSLAATTLKEIERACRRGNIGQGATYVEHGLLFGCHLGRTELGYRVTYEFLGRASRTR